MNYAEKLENYGFQKDPQARRRISHVAHDPELEMWQTAMSINYKRHEGSFLRPERLISTRNLFKTAKKMNEPVNLHQI